MPTLGSPATLRHVASASRALVAGVPMLVAVMFTGLILFVGIFVGKQRRDYALKAARCVTDMVKTLNGPSKPPDADTPPASPERPVPE